MAKRARAKAVKAKTVKARSRRARAASKPAKRTSKAKAAPRPVRKLAPKTAGLLERLAAGPVVCAEGYVFELERRGYLRAGPYVPEVVLDHPEVVERLHRDFVHAGSDVVEALTYYAHRDKLRMIGRERDLERLNRQALGIAKKVARDTGTLFAGNISNTNIYDPADAASIEAVRAMFAEQVEWAADAGCDFIIGETYGYAGEAILAAEAIKGTGLPAVVTLAMHREETTREGLSVGEAAKRLEAAGAAVVGLNCSRGPGTMLPLLKDVREAVSCHVAALPVPYRTVALQPTFQSLMDPAWADLPGGRPFPTALDPFLCNRYEIAAFARQAYDLGVRYLGVCCGNGPHFVRSMAEALGRQPPASRFSPDMAKHSYYGTDERLKKVNIDYRDRL
jgi:betaine-homocysteine S-methyltransferase